ncbi:hypothetical protein BDF14DRAFT_521036 [Spinellus fusiger]|nr:hypothetical protein BDF14DRAFT_521036 [Spinellus fusiger]
MSHSAQNEPTSRTEALAKEAQVLILEKDALEEELRTLLEGLRSQGVGMDTPLVDREGFPRSDIDVAAARVARSRVYELRNDHTALMSKIEKAMHVIHQVSRAEASNTPRPNDSTNSNSPVQSTSSNSNHNINTSNTAPTAPTPFALVNAVAPDSPAKSAGLCKGDQIFRFGKVTTSLPPSQNYLQAVSDVVVASEGQPILLNVMRDSQIVLLTLIPRRGWGGRGTLGCHLLPIE